HALSHVLPPLGSLVAKETQGSVGYGILVGPAATAAAIEAFRARLTANPHAYIAQPPLCLSTRPTFVENSIAPRHIDLRPFVLSGRETRVVPGGLTRVALREGPPVVDSSQGGGTTDTWVAADDGCLPTVSTTAPDLFWMSRYLARAANLPRTPAVIYALSAIPPAGRGG
ncbi:hypothetical protein EWW49_28925, partial [Pseudomonas syringae]